MDKKVLFSFLSFYLTLSLFCCCTNSSKQAEQERLDSIRIADSLATVQRMSDSIRVADSIANIPGQIKKMLGDAYTAATTSQKEAVNKYGTPEFVQNSAKSLNAGINMFGPSMYDFCSDESTKPDGCVVENVVIKDVANSSATAEVTVRYNIMEMDYECDQYKKTSSDSDTYIVILNFVDGSWKISDIKYKSSGESLTKRWATLA